MEQYLIDSNAVIDYLSGKLPENGKIFMNLVVNNIPNISIITKIEILGFKTSSDAYQLLNGFVDDSVIIGLNEEIVQRTIEIKREYKLKTPDAIIAATALSNQLTLISRNLKDFALVQRLSVLNPHDL